MPSITAAQSVGGLSTSSLTTPSFTPSGSNRAVFSSNAIRGADVSENRYGGSGGTLIDLLNEVSMDFSLGAIDVYGEATGSNPGSSTTGYQANNGANETTLAMMFLDGVDQTTPFGTAVTGNSFSGDTTFTIAVAFTGLTAGDVVVAGVGVGGSGDCTGLSISAGTNCTVPSNGSASAINGTSSGAAAAVGYGTATGSTLTINFTVSNPNGAFCGYAYVGRPVNEASAGAEGPVGRADETDTAIARGSARPAGLATETDTSLALARVQIRATGRADEVDTALALAGLQLRAVGLAVETDTAIPRGSARPAGRADETDTALALTSGQSGVVGTAVETDTAFALGVARPAGRADEVDTAIALAPLQLRATGVSTETDTALGLAGLQLRAVGRADETDTAFALPLGGALAVGLATETDTAFALAGTQIIAVIPQTAFSEMPGSTGKAEKRAPRLRAPRQVKAVRAARQVAPLPPLVAPVGMAVEADEALSLMSLVIQQGLARTKPKAALQRSSNEERISYLEREVSTLRRALSSTRGR